VVLDTSVVITALRSSNGAAAENIRLALLEEVVILMGYKLACEYRDVALRPEHLAVAGKTREDTILLLDMLEAVAEPAEIVICRRPLSLDANDDMVLDVAINGNADGIVTNNTKHFREPANHLHLAVWTPAEFLRQFRKRS
jgi:putative PIN family toxin of toxin-antitoxin system